MEISKSSSVISSKVTLMQDLALLNDEGCANKAHYSIDLDDEDIDLIAILSEN